jgi:hypothetical protein
MGTATPVELAGFDRLLTAVLDTPDQVARMVSEEPALLEYVNNATETVLHWLAVENEVEGIRLLHGLGAGISEFALLHALELGHVETVDLLLSLGGDFADLDPFQAMRNPVFGLSEEKVTTLSSCLARHDVWPKP